MIQDLPYILYWWLMLFGLGLLVFPLTKRLFIKFFDLGYPFAKILGILLLSYLVWLLGSLKILPFFRETVGLVIIILALTNFLIFTKDRQRKKENLPKKGAARKIAKGDHVPAPLSRFTGLYGAAALKIGRIFIFEEILFLLGLLFWSFVRAHEPAIHGLEKFMDYGFINSILRSKFFPPHDMWLSPSPDPRYTGSFTINYYYFGHLTAAVLTRLSGLDSAITYNLVLATLFGLCFTGAFSIGGNLLFAKGAGKPREVGATSAPSFKIILFAGLLTAFLVTLAGNLHPIYLFLKDSAKYWYPDATRFIPFTIHEFPSYSWVVADLHGHVFDIPFVLLAIAMLIAIYLKTQNSIFDPEASGEKTRDESRVKLKTTTQISKLRKMSERFKDLTCRLTPLSQLLFSLRSKIDICHLRFEIILLGLILAVLYMTNAWDGIIYFGLSGLVFLVTILCSKRLPNRLPKTKNEKFKIKNYIAKLKSFKFLTVVFTFSFLIFSFFLFSLPFNHYFHPFVKGIGVNCPPSFVPEKVGPFLFEKGNCQRSPLYMLAILWGFFYFNAAAFILNSRITRIKPRINANIRVNSNIIRVIRESNAPDIFILLMIFLSTLLLIFPEFFYAKDIYPAHFRANTMFKLGYQAFIMLSIVSGYTIIQLLTRIRQKSSVLGPLDKIRIKIEYQGKTVKFQLPFGLLRFGFYSLLFFQLFLVLIYPYYAINSYYGNLRFYRGLNGIKWLQDQYPDDFQAILWLKNLQPTTTRLSSPKSDNLQPVVVEAVGESYTDYARVSAYTGLPTILGWPVHEWLWRGSYDEAGKRIPEVQAIYESQDLKETKKLLEKYNVSYVFMGNLEREKYKNLNEEKFARIGKVVFESGGTKIYRIKI